MKTYLLSTLTQIAFVLVTNCVHQAECGTYCECKATAVGYCDSSAPYDCWCSAGYEEGDDGCKADNTICNGDANPLNCQDEDECARTKGPKPCHNSATCRNTIGSYTCECKPGYRGNGQNCEPIGPEPPPPPPAPQPTKPKRNMKCLRWSYRRYRCGQCKWYRAKGQRTCRNNVRRLLDRVRRRMRRRGQRRRKQ